MSEAALAPTPSQRAHRVPARTPRNRLNSLEALERGFALFRSTFAREAWRYYAGSAPLVLCFVPMWVVNGQIRLSDGVVTDGGGITRRSLSSARVHGRQLHATRSRASVWHAHIETRRSNRASGSRGASAGVEDHPECRCVSGAANLRRGAVVLQRMPICQS